MLDARVPIEDSNVKDGDSLMLHITKAQVRGSLRSFAALRGDCSVVRGVMMGLEATVVLCRVS